jgi:hypothetical protein
MKKLMTAAFLLFIVSVGCKKSSVSNVATTDTTETVNVSLNSGESYKYSINANTSQVAITSDAQNAAQSRVSIVPGIDSLSTYEYVPATGFTGTDVVTIQVTPTTPTGPNASGCQHHGQQTQHPDSCTGHGSHHHGKHGPPPSGGCGAKSATGVKQIKLCFTVAASKN